MKGVSTLLKNEGSIYLITPYSILAEVPYFLLQGVSTLSKMQGVSALFLTARSIYLFLYGRSFYVTSGSIYLI